MPIFRSLRKQRGLAAVETVITLPIYLLFTLAILDFGRVMYAANATTTAARAAVSFGAQSPATAVQYGGMHQAAVTDAKDLVANDANPGAITTTQRRFCRCPGSNLETSCVSNTCAGAPEIYVEVTSQRLFETVVDYPLIPNPINIQRTAVFRVQ